MPLKRMFVFIVCIVLVGLFIWTIGVRTAAGAVVGSVAALLLRPHLKELEGRGVFDFIGYMDLGWAILLCFAVLVSLIALMSWLLSWVFDQYGVAQVMTGAFGGAVTALMFRPYLVIQLRRDRAHD